MMTSKQRATKTCEPVSWRHCACPTVPVVILNAKVLHLIPRTCRSLVWMLRTPLCTPPPHGNAPCTSLPS